MLLFLQLLAVNTVWAQKPRPVSQPGVEIAQRLMNTLPHLPSVIHSHMEGKPEELKGMISHMLGDGLISQLVVNPLGVAEGMGISLSSVGINKTDAEHKMLVGSTNSSGISSLSLDAKSLPTTGKIMYLDGVPIKDFDHFVRNRNLEERFPTSKPPLTTTAVPSANDIATAVLDKLKTSYPQVNFNIPGIPEAKYLHCGPKVPSKTEMTLSKEDGLSKNLEISIFDPTKLLVNTQLRRAPQNVGSNIFPSKFFIQSSENPVADASESFLRSFDPEIDHVVSSLRIGSVTNVERVKQLQNILQIYEQGLQTKELVAKRKQLQILQNELLYQREKIEDQKSMEKELRKKEQELEQRRNTMEIQLRQQLNLWHSSFSNSKEEPILFTSNGTQMWPPVLIKRKNKNIQLSQTK
ncbi:hypothetical protein NECAME_16150 [Necator americanus]|uniref:Uncharacterized protein n=1 Tax=Necator americanus TaxID=51031 RepID=W2TXI0_NECAM|nr:hypothetical protein NECAME_16150 [Necator americanus]ETN86760.1 hypothetical protein NECAME_16150 [Necator americanus]